MYRFVLGVVLGVGACSVPEVEPEALASGQCVRVGSEVVCPGDLPSRHRPLPASTSALNRATCRELLDRSGMDRINTCPLQPGDAGEVKLPAEALCMRDSYVLTALVYCWRSECLQAAGVTEADHLAAKAPSSPDWEAQAARKMLEVADGLCRVATAGTTCTTSAIVNCSEPSDAPGVSHEPPRYTSITAGASEAVTVAIADTDPLAGPAGTQAHR